MFGACGSEPNGHSAVPYAIVTVKYFWAVMIDCLLPVVYDVIDRHKI